MMTDNHTPSDKCISEFRKITHLSEITPDIDTFFFDMYGLLWSGYDFYPGVLDLLIKLRSQGKKVYILSNVTALREKFIRDKAAKGLLLGTHYDDVITSGEVCADAIQKGLLEKLTCKKEYRIMNVGVYNKELCEPIKMHETDDIQKADGVYCSGVQGQGKEETIDHLIPIMRAALERRLPAVCANPDLSFMSGDKQLPTQGALGKWYEAHGGYVYYLGKPYRNIYDYAFMRTQTTSERALMGGDALDTDILGGHNAGLKTLLATGTGLTGRRMAAGKSLETQMQEEGVVPDFVIERLADPNNE